MTDDVTHVLDSYAIRELAQRDAVAVSFAELFDPAVESGPFGACPDGTEAFYANFFALRKEHAFLQVGTHQVDLISDDTASGVCFTRSRGGVPRKVWSDVMVCCLDTYKKTDGRWGFLHRRKTVQAVTERHSDEVAISPLAEGQSRDEPDRQSAFLGVLAQMEGKGAGCVLGVGPS